MTSWEPWPGSVVTDRGIEVPELHLITPQEGKHSKTFQNIPKLSASVQTVQTVQTQKFQKSRSQGTAHAGLGGDLVLFLLRREDCRHQ